MDRRIFLKGLAGLTAASFLPWTAAGQTGRQPLGYLRTNWSKDPHTYGSYSYIAKGARRRDIRTLREPLNGRIFFAGEAVNESHNSTVDAAYESGLAAARDVEGEGGQYIAIVGAGISGLAAAKALSEVGRKVTVYESRDRIGGRINTDRSLGPALDLGASWIHGIDDNPVAALADTLGLDTDVTEDGFAILGSGGEQVKRRKAPKWLENVSEYQHVAGADRDQINRRAYWFRGGYGGDEVVFENGYDDILKGLEGDYRTFLSKPVTRIALRGQRVDVTADEDDLIDYDAVIVTVPLGVLKQNLIRFEPALPTRKLSAIARMGMGTLDKVYLLYEHAFWHREADWILTPDNGLEPGQFNQWFNAAKYVDAPVIMAFNGGPPALELAELSDAALIEKAVQTLTSAYPA